MSDEIWKRDEVESPCVKVCVIHPDARLCLGCYRSAEEIAEWGRMTPAMRQIVMADLAGRASRITGTRRGRAARVAARRTEQQK